MNDDHGDRFPGALPARAPSSPARPGGADRRGRMRSARAQERTTTLTRLGRSTRRSMPRFDRYTLDVFNPGHPFRPHAGR